MAMTRPSGGKRPGRVAPSLPDRRAFLAGAAATALAACAPRKPAEDARARIDALFDHLRDQSKAIEPIRKEEYAQRRARLGAVLQSLDAGALLVEGGSTMTYLSGVSWGRSERLFALVVLSDGSHFWLCPAFEEARARAVIDPPKGVGGDVLAWQEHEYPFAPLASALREKRVFRLMIEPQLRWIFAERLADVYGRDRLASGHPAVFALRAKKDAHEIALLRRANELTQLAIVETAKTLEPGLTAGEIAARIDRAHEKLGMRGAWSVCLIGAAAALPHGSARDMRLAKGDVLLMDVGASLHGYQSDETRTFVFDGTPGVDIEKAWNTVRDAQRRAFELARPLAPCRSVDAAARALIAERGFGTDYSALTHRLGHGIGLDPHEDPYFDGGSDVLLEAGMTLTNEPGIYIPGHFGVRLEDVVLVTPGGADHFGDWQKTPRWPA